MIIYFVSTQDMHGALREAPSADWHPTRADAEELAQRLADRSGKVHLVYAVEAQDYFEPTISIEPDLDLIGYKLWNPPLHSTSPPRGIGPEDYVSVILRDGNVLSPEVASHFAWSVNYMKHDPSDIIAYRLASLTE